MRTLALLFAVLIAGAAWAPASAQPFRARQGVQSGDMRSLDEILDGIRRDRPGNLADVEGPNDGPSGNPRYRLKWLTPDGRVLFLDTDARTGRVLGVEGDDRGPPGPPARGFGPRGAIPPDLSPALGFGPTGRPSDFGGRRRFNDEPDDGPPPGPRRRFRER